MPRYTWAPEEDEDTREGRADSRFMSAQRATTDELLRPTLSADFDVHAFRKPWNPRHLVWSGFLGGPLSGGVLAALNYRRLNQNSRAFVALAVTLVVCLAFAVAWALWGPPLDEARGRQSWHLPVRAVGCVLTLALSAPQNKLFDAYRAADLEPGKLLWPAVAAILVLGFLQNVFLLFVTLL